MFTYAHVKWFYGQSERAYYLNYFIIFVINEYFSIGLTNGNCDVGPKPMQPFFSERDH